MGKFWINMPRNILGYMEGLDKFFDFAFANNGARKKIICHVRIATLPNGNVMKKCTST